jgi:DNA-binding response OmpR family regulator
MVKKKILTVDNEEDTVNLIKMILEDAGYEVETALSGKECLERMEQKNFDLVLLDIMMPDMSGWDVFDKIKRMGKLEKTRVAFLSVLECSPARKKKLIEEGLADYINKPFKPEELVKRVKSIIG